MPSLILIVVLLASLQQPTPFGPADYLITSNGIGKLRIGMTLDEARKALPSARFARSADGDGALLVDVMLRSAEFITLDASETAKEIDWSARIRSIESSHPAFHTDRGVRPGAVVRDVERVYGQARLIDVQDVKSREIVTFEKGPAGVGFILEPGSAILDGAANPDGSRTTQRFKPDARIRAVWVAGR